MFGYKKKKKEKKVDITTKQKRGSHINLINYYNSSGEMGKKPDHWTDKDVSDYIQNHAN
jgi:hypothetical protein|tara:strand:+ start:333 stop:509 length:177 start_codon:yes stop_codon:yes gene_type:complete